MNRKTIIAILLVFCSLVFRCNVFAQSVPEKETEDLDFAQGLLSRGLYDMAANEYQKFIANHPQSTYLQEANLAVGECYFLLQDNAKAIDAFNHFKQLYPNSEKTPTATLRLGQIYIEQGRFDDAIKELTSADPAQLKAETLQSFYFYIGKAYRGKNDAASALKFLQKASEVTGVQAQTPYAFQELAEVHVQNKEYKEAVEAYTKALQATQEDSLKGYLLYKLGEAQFLSENYAEAINQFNQVLTQYPNLEITKDALTNLLLAHFNLAQYDQLMTAYQNNAKLIKEDGAYTPVFLTVAKALAALKKFDEAIALLDKTAALPNSKDEDKRKVALKKAEILINAKKYQDGLAILEGPLPAGDGAGADEISFLKAQAHYGLGQFDKASESFQEVKNSNADSNYAHASLLGMAHAFQESKNYKEADARFLEYYASEKDDNLKSEALYDAALMEVKLNANDQAVAHAQEYLDKFSTGSRYEQSLLMLGDLYSKTNQFEKAVNLLQDYLTKAKQIQRLDSVEFLLGYNLQLLARGNEAIATYSKVPLNKDDPQFFVSAMKNTAAIYIGEKKEAEAAAAFDQLISAVDKNVLEVKTYLWVCEQYLKQKKFNDILRITDKAQKFFPNDSVQETAYFRAEASRELKDFDNAAKLYDVVLTSTAKSMYTGGAHIGKGLILIEAKKFDEAKAEFQKAIDENADDHTITLRARYEMANIASAQNNPEEALKFYLLVGTIYDDDTYCPDSLLRAGKILETLNRKEEAVKLYQEIQDRYKDSPAAHECQERISASK